MRKGLLTPNRIRFRPPIRPSSIPKTLLSMSAISVEKSKGLSKAQQMLAQASGLCVVSDSFAGSDYRTKTQSGKRTARSILDQISKDCDYNWWKRGPVIECRDRHWLARREAQIPEAWLTKVALGPREWLSRSGRPCPNR